MQKQEFEGDEGNLIHVLKDHPERGNTVEEVESVFADTWVIIRLDKIVKEEKRFLALGEGVSGQIKVVIFVFQNDRIRPISCWEAKKKLMIHYHDERRKKEIRN